MKQDRARKKTDRILNDIEGAISALYSNSPELRKAGVKYRTYMKRVDMLTRSVQNALKKETDKDIKAKLKADYQRQIEALTVQSTEYQKIIEEFAYQLAIVNQKALDIINSRMDEIYILNYNQVADECRRVGMEIKNG